MGCCDDAGQSENEFHMACCFFKQIQRFGKFLWITFVNIFFKSVNVGFVPFLKRHVAKTAWKCGQYQPIDYVFGFKNGVAERRLEIFKNFQCMA